MLAVDERWTPPSEDVDSRLLPKRLRRGAESVEVRVGAGSAGVCSESCLLKRPMVVNDVCVVDVGLEWFEV